MAPIRRSRRLEQNATDSQEKAEATAAAASTPAARKAASAKKKMTAASGPKAAPAGTIAKRPAAAQPKTKTKKSTPTRKAPTAATTKATTTSTPRKAPATTKTAVTTKAKATAARENEAKPKAKRVKKVKEETTKVEEKEAKSKAKEVKKVKKESTTAEEKEAKPRAKRAKKSKNDTAPAATVGGEEMEPKIKTKRARKAKKEDGDTTTSTASARQKKRKADPEDGTDGNGEGSSQAGPVTKKPKTTRGKKTGVAGAIEPSKPIVVNKSDPCSVLPTELWHEVMSYLSLSQIVKASSVSKSWLEGTQALPVWRDICTKAALGSPKKKYPTHMSLVCSQSYWICERCLTLNNGKGSDIPLPVEIVELANEKMMLCRACRCQYYEKHPEPTRLRKNVRNGYGEYIDARDVRITKTDACTKYFLKDEDLKSLNAIVKRNPRFRNAAPMKLYLERRVQKQALKVHGGWIGIQAITNEVAKTRRMGAKKRPQELQTHVVQSTDEETTEKNKDTSSTKGKMPMTQAASLVTNDENLRTWVRILEEPQRKALVVEAIAEAERRIAAGEPPLVTNFETMAPDHKWIHALRLSLYANGLMREQTKRIVWDFEAGVYDALKTSASSTEVADAGAGTGAMGSAGAGSSSSMAALRTATGTTVYAV
ncbi:hypothetical protein BKA57DRAFT_477321 [Linnemannia elongata]|nr:hypothetical protein BKA57DRAFT_477321 [Linnemannia elongata]